MSDQKDKNKNNVVNIEKFQPKQIDYFTKEEMPFTLVCNKVINECQNPVAGFIWIYLQSKPTTWKPCKWEIMKRFDISERTYQRHMSYLSSTNLIEYYTTRGKGGKVEDWRIVVLNGSRFNPKADDYKGTQYSVHVNHTAKNGVVDNPAPDKGFDNTAKNGVVDVNHTAKKPHSGEMATYINKDITSLEKKDLTHTQEDFFLEQNLFIDSEQQRKAIVMRKLCLNDEKSKAKHASLKTDKTFVEVLDECVSHYATQQKPQLVSPQRLQSWLNRESRFQQQQSFAKPANKYPTKAERDAEEIKIKAREKEDEARKKAEIEAGKGFKDLVKKAKTHVDLKAVRAKQEAERLALGLSVTEYHEKYVINKGTVQE